MTNKVTEDELKAHAEKIGGRRVTLDALKENIAKVDHYIHPGSQLTVCIITLQNGFTVTGQSACADPKMFNEEIGKRISQADAENKIWPLMGYSLKQELYLLGQGVNPYGSAPLRLVKTQPDMKAYVGTKAINAKPITRGEYNAVRGWAIPEDENPEDEGYMVEYAESFEGNVEGYDGYVTWSPKDVFERAYKEISTDSQSFLGRMKEEHEGLRDKYLKADAFINGSELYRTLPVEEQRDLQEQRTAMHVYLEILWRRIQRNS